MTSSLQICPSMAEFNDIKNDINKAVAVSSGNGTRNSNAQSNSSCHWQRRGIWCCVDAWIKLADAMPTYSARLVYTGLPVASHSTISVATLDGSGGTVILMPADNGGLQVVTRATAIAAGGVVWGSVVYPISI